MEQYTGWVILFVVIALLYLAGLLVEVVRDNVRYGKQKAEFVQEIGTLRAKVAEWEDYAEELQNTADQLDKKEKLFRRLFKERTENYPVVGKIWANLIELSDGEREKALRYKARPAVKAADEIKAIKKEKRDLVKELVYWKYKSQNYEAIYPWLAEELEQDIQSEAEAEYYSVYTESEREDPVSRLISPAAYRSLDTSARNQLALDRYWQQGKKSKWMIGKMYERYVGFLYEQDGWEVTYFGIHKRFEDLGRDLIAIKAGNIHVVQCKNWSRFKTIYENHIFQLFGTSFGLQQEHKNKTVTPVFFCSTSLSETANEFARRLGITVHQRHSFRQYPAVKCNISTNGDKIYHLPFDQQYDTAKITPRTGEFYAKNVAEAEKNGFRRAYKWKGTKV